MSDDNRKIEDDRDAMPSEYRAIKDMIRNRVPAGITHEQVKKLEDDLKAPRTFKSLVALLMDGLSYGNWPWVDFSKAGK